MTVHAEVSPATERTPVLAADSPPFDLAFDLRNFAAQNLSLEDQRLFAHWIVRRASELTTGDVLLIVSPGFPGDGLEEDGDGKVHVETLGSPSAPIVPLLKRHASGRQPLVVHCDGGFWLDDELGLLVAEHVKSRRALTQFRIQPGYFPIVMSPAGLSGLSDGVHDLISHCSTMARSGASAVALSEMDLPNRQIFLKPDEPETLALLRDACANNLKRGDLVVTEEVRQFWVQNRQVLRERLHRIDALCGLRGKRVLELGATGQHDVVMREMLEKYGAARYWALNPGPFRYKPYSEKAKFIRRSVHEAEFLPNTFDLVLSLGFLERVENPRGLFEKVRDWTAPNGYHYGLFEIWSSARGHHVHPPTYPALKIPEFGHLYLSESEMRDTLTRAGVLAETAEEMVKRIYQDEHINRVGLKQFLQIIADSRMEIVLLDGRGNGKLHPKAKEVSARLDNEYSPQELSAVGLEFMLRKSEAGLTLRPRAGKPGEAESSDVRPTFIQHRHVEELESEAGPDYDLAIDLRKLTPQNVSLDDQRLFGGWILRRARTLTAGNVLLIVAEDFPLDQLASAGFPAAGLLDGANRIRVEVAPTRDESIVPALKRLSSGRPMVVHCDGGFWIDEELRRLVGNHLKTDAGITVYRIQPGYFPVVMTPTALMGLKDTLRDIISYVTSSAKTAKGDVMASELNLAKRQIYLKPDEPEAQAFLRAACQKNVKRAGLVPNDGVLQFWVMNRRLLRERMRRLDALCGLRGKRVLELGCAVKHDIVVRELLDVYDVRSYCGLNIEPFEYKPAADNVTLIQGDVLNAKFKPDSFDLVFSLAFLEHAPDSAFVFKLINKWLRDGGFHYGLFEIWSSARGHHLYSPTYPSHIVPEFGHIFLTREELRTVLTKARLNEAVIEDMLRRVYDDPYINRLGAQEYLKIIDDSGLDVLLIDGRSNGVLHPQAKAVSAYIKGKYSPAELSAFGLEFLLRKSEVQIGRMGRLVEPSLAAA